MNLVLDQNGKLLMDKEALYNKLPTTLQDVAINLQGRKIKNRRYDKEFESIKNSISNKCFLSLEDVYLESIHRLKMRLNKAYKNSSFYKEYINSNEIDINSIKSIDDIKNFPILTKGIINNNLKGIVERTAKTNEVHNAHTSGTSGAGLIFPETLKAEQYQWAVWWRYRNQHGIFQNTKCALFGGRVIVPHTTQKPPFYRDVKPLNQMMFSMYHLNEDNIRSYVEALNKQRLEWIHGYPSTISNLARLISDAGLSLDYQVKWITTGAENLLANQKNIIEKAFNTKVRQHYGLAEGVANISECEEGRLHVDEDFSLVEFVKHESDKYKIIGTNLFNEAMLFFRYDTNDLAKLSENACSCGRCGRVVEKIFGRAEDFVVLNDDTLIGRLDHIFKDLTEIYEAQIYQQKKGEIEVRVVKRKGFDSFGGEDKLKHSIEKYLGGRVRYKIVYPSAIEKTKSGKLKFVVSDIQKIR